MRGLGSRRWTTAPFALASRSHRTAAESDAIAVMEKRRRSKPANAKGRREEATQLLRTMDRAVHGESGELSGPSE